MNSIASTADVDVGDDVVYPRVYRHKAAQTEAAVTGFPPGDITVDMHRYAGAQGAAPDLEADTGSSVFEEEEPKMTVKMTPELKGFMNAHGEAEEEMKRENERREKEKEALKGLSRWHW